MNQKNYIIHYRMNKKVQPIAVLESLEALILKYCVSYSECFLRLDVGICEFEYEGKLHSNRNKNAINTLLARHPRLKPFYQYTRDIVEDGVHEGLSLCNFEKHDYSYKGEIEYDLIREIVKKVPIPYAVNRLQLIYNGVGFGEKTESAKIRNNESGFGAPVGDYILYDRIKYGSEKHAYILFSVSGEKIETMRKLFFDFAQEIPGKYEETEIV